MKQPSFAYYNRVNTDLLKCIPPDATTVVEVGCGAGALGEQYKLLNPFCRYIGLELEENAAQSAAARIEVRTGNAEQINLREIIPDGTDCLVYGDVLEHMVDPWKTLKTHASLLKEKGQVVACIPNIQHWSVLLNLLAGKWEYQPEGLLDRTHLRFFTFETITKLFADAGLNIYDIQARRHAQPQFRAFQEAFQPVLTKLGLDQTAFFARTSALQYIVRAGKQPVTKRLLIQSLLGETKVCSRVRITEPDTFLATIPGVRIIEHAGKTSTAVGLANEDKIFIWQRVFPATPDQQQQLLNNNYLTIAEIDDDPLRWSEHEQNNFFAFRSCHAVQTSTQELADFIRRYNPNVAVLPNQLAALPPLKEPKRNQPVTLFFGALNREDDWKPIMPAINSVLAEFKDVKVKVVHDRAFFEALMTPNKEFTPFCPYVEYIRILTSADIGILPLENCRFNKMKSDLKFLECAAYGVATLASPTVYAGTIRHGETGFIYHSPAEFAAYLKDLISSRDLRASLTLSAYNWVRKHRLLHKHYRTRYEWYRQLLANRPALTAQLRHRTPELNV